MPRSSSSSTVVAIDARRLEPPEPGHGALCIFVDDVDALYAELVARKAKLLKGPQDCDYGMREFDAVDLDGNKIFFGMGIEKPA